jgi:hypothetical protein
VIWSFTVSAGGSRETPFSPKASLFAFVNIASGKPMTAAMAREHYVLIEALRSIEEPEFTAVVRKTFTGFALRWVGTTTQSKEASVA